MSLTSRERVEIVLKGKSADKIPFTIYNDMLPQCFTERKLRNDGLCMVRRDIKVYQELTPNVKTTSYSYVENGKHLTRIENETPVGNVNSIVEPNDFTSWTHKKVFTSPDDYKVLLFMINDIQYKTCYQNYIKAQNADGGDCVFRGNLGLEPMQMMISYYMGIETFCIEWFERQDEILKLYNALVEKRKELYPICADSPCLIFNYGGNVVPELLGKERFDQYYVPIYNEAAEILHRKGKIIGVHFDANCKHISESIASTDLDYIEAFTPAPDTDMTLAEARKAWPDKVLWMNYPSSVHLESIEKIKKTTDDLLDELDGNYNNFVMGITEDIPSDRWQENLLAISNVLNSRGISK